MDLEGGLNTDEFFGMLHIFRRTPGAPLGPSPRISRCLEWRHLNRRLEEAPFCPFFLDPADSLSSGWNLHGFFMQALQGPLFHEEIQGELDPTIQQLVLNHVVDGNFAKSCWSTTSIGSVISSTELRLKSQSGQDLNLTMNDKNVIINGDARIIQEDIFSEDGIIQIIDKVLVLT